MKKVTTVAISALTALATLAPGAMAQGASASYANHVVLGQTVRSTGINFKINPVECWEKSAMGWYWAYHNEMVICQEGKRQAGVEVQWSEEDLDTLRHEAQHLIQDCMDGSRQGALTSVYRDVPALVKNTLSNTAIQNIIDAYSDSSDHIIMMELEAFAVAAINDPMEQANDIKKFCF